MQNGTKTRTMALLLLKASELRARIKPDFVAQCWAERKEEDGEKEREEGGVGGGGKERGGEGGGMGWRESE